jgi:hypothetical protein
MKLFFFFFEYNVWEGFRVSWTGCWRASKSILPAYLTCYTRFIYLLSCVKLNKRTRSLCSRHSSGLETPVILYPGMLTATSTV